MDVTKQNEAIEEFVREAARQIESAKERVIDMEKALRTDLEAARNAHVDLADVTKATHVLVGVGSVYADGQPNYPRRVELTIAGANQIMLGEIDVTKPKKGNTARYRAIVLLFKEGE